MITVEELRNYLGVDSDSDPEIKTARDAALEELKRVTGVNWENAQNCSVANEAVQAMVYLNYWGIRDSAKNTEFLQKHINKKIKLLQNSEEAQNGIQ